MAVHTLGSGRLQNVRVINMSQECLFWCGHVPPAGFCLCFPLLSISFLEKYCGIYLATFDFACHICCLARCVANGRSLWGMPKFTSCSESKVTSSIAGQGSPLQLFEQGAPLLGT